ncbi:discoidin domain-containing protein [Actimicrobium sp. CCI2.3]|uniref:discoidin domain-containing protein n=1 Tax=Actimicrobium sp. CCI2.3 TaxID=3048616 RepID=UPI002AB58679|nr:discoidin domain-containing protein [Actimicrobium sp. CCI2.3]MDY7574698.1 discoidin domain-containing protein [Actimicrobium sp. CCI2.3]
MNRSGWRVTASPNFSQDTEKAIDGNLSSRWTTSSNNQRPGMYFQIDFGESLSFDKIEMNVGDSLGDYLRGYAIYATDDLAVLGSPIASGTGAIVTSIVVPETKARYVRIVSTDSAQYNWWSIAEINVSGWQPKRTPLNIPVGGSISNVNANGAPTNIRVGGSISNVSANGTPTDVRAVGSISNVSANANTDLPAGSIYKLTSINVDFGKTDANKFFMTAASAGSGGEVELRLDSKPDKVFGRCFFHHTGSPLYFLEYECESKETVTGPQTVLMKFQDYSDPDGGQLLKVNLFRYDYVETSSSSENNPNGKLNVYGNGGTVNDVNVSPKPEPALGDEKPSPYYDISIIRTADMQFDSKGKDYNNVNNWYRPFAFFTECPLPSSPKIDIEKGYYVGMIGGWSHTFTNFELEADTEIVVKISRKSSNSFGAPAGGITSAKAYPENKRISVDVINGDVYIKMRNPAQISVDIDGQMDSRDAPRAKINWEDGEFPYVGRDKGSHAVSIFANPVIKNKPKSGARVVYIEAGKEIPEWLKGKNADDKTKSSDADNFDTVVFGPGVHNVSVKSPGVERDREYGDWIKLFPDKTYYIPGDAIVYGNFSYINVDSRRERKNIRIFGHGTISGRKIPHHTVSTVSNDISYGIHVEDAGNINIEGITLIDSANHNFYVNGVYPEKNSIQFVKVIGWRGNTDAASISGNILMEDSFFRVQDDGHYIGGALPLRRIVFWHDVNGQDFRGGLGLNREGFGPIIDLKRLPYMQKQIVIEDIDIIYARSIFAVGDPENGLIGLNGESVDDPKNPDGSKIVPKDNDIINTGQMIVFRNIRISDPKPNRAIFEINAIRPTALHNYAGIRFENINYEHIESFGWKNTLKGGPTGISKFVFDNISIAGKKVDLPYVSNPVNFKFDKNSVFDLTFRIRDIVAPASYTLTRTAINGSIDLVQNGSNSVTVMPSNQADPSYEFSQWGGDASGSDNPLTFTMNRDMAITAYFKKRK